MGDAPDVPELQEDQTAGLVHRVGCLANDESGRSSLRVVAGVERRGNIARLAGTRARERCHDHAVGQVVAPQLDGMKPPFRGHVPRSDGRRDGWRGHDALLSPPIRMSGSTVLSI